MNLLFSYSRNEDDNYAAAGHRFLGAGHDKDGEEVHVFLHKDEELAPTNTERKGDKQDVKLA